jgi:hypothetical protein
VHLVWNGCEIEIQNGHLDYDRAGRREVPMANRTGGVRMGFGVCCALSRCPDDEGDLAGPALCDQRTRTSSTSALPSV